MFQDNAIETKQIGTNLLKQTIISNTSNSQNK